MLGRAQAQTAPSKWFANNKQNVNSQVVTAELVQSTTFLSPTQIIAKTIGFAVQVIVSACAACDGEIRLNGSINGIDFALIPGCEVPYNADGSFLFNVPAQYFPHLQIEVTETTGSPTIIDAWFSVKEDIGG